LTDEEELERAEQTKDAAKTEVGPYLKNATLSWSTPGSETDDGFRLSCINAECVYGGLTVIAGPVGSGKSSFLLGLLEEMRLLDGERFLPRGDGVAYVAQTAWLQSLTIKDNILFGDPYEAKRYNAVLEACGLSEDIAKLDAGDLTEVWIESVALNIDAYPLTLQSRSASKEVGNLMGVGFYKDNADISSHLIRRSKSTIGIGKSMLA